MAHVDFKPPEEEDDDASGALMAVLAWLVAGGAVGVSVGFTLDLMGWRAGAPVLAALGGGLFAVLGFLAWILERIQARKLVAVADVRGRLRRRRSFWLVAVPIALMIVGLVWMVIVGSVRAESLWAGVGFGGIAMGLTILFVPLWGQHLLGRGVESATMGDTDEARASLGRVSRGWWYGRLPRSIATLNLGYVELEAGQLDKALVCFESVRHERVEAQARVGQALCLVKKGLWERAEAALQAAYLPTGGRPKQHELDGVRLLLLLHRDGSEVAREVGEPLLTGQVGELFRGVLASARRSCGDGVGAQELLDDAVIQTLTPISLSLSLY